MLPQIAVQWHESDLVDFTPVSAPALPTDTLAKYISSVAAQSRASSSIAQATQIPNPTQQSPSSQPVDATSRGGLSTGAKTGIGAGVGGAALVILIGLGIWFWRRKMKHVDGRAGHTGYQSYFQETAERPMASKGPAELHNQSIRPELSGLSQRHEMSGYGRGQEMTGGVKPQFRSELA